MDRIERVVIVGGGTAGWLAAMFLDTALNRTEDRPVSITLIETSDIPIVGVGEATVPHLIRTLRFLNLDEKEFMRATEATFKTAINFVNWGKSDEHDEYWVPLHPTPKVDEFSPVKDFDISSYWMYLQSMGNKAVGKYDESCFKAVTVCQSYKAPRMLDSPSFQYMDGDMSYAYHIDAGLFGEYLKKKAKARGVQQVLDFVEDAVLDDRGFIDHLTTRENGNFSADLFIDCTGFRAMLINKILDVPFVSYADDLICDRASAIRVPMEYAPGEMRPYTMSTALNNGWVWDIPLHTRRGTGYVYCSHYTSEEEAEAEHRAYLGPKAMGLNARHLKMRIGRSERGWVNNCLSLGLSNGFVEPLESTGIWMISLGLFQFLKHFPDKSMSQDKQEKFNTTMKGYYEEIRDFILMHYVFTEREDTEFWKFHKYHPRRTELEDQAREHWENRWPLGPRYGPTLFPDSTYFCVSAGLGFLPTETSHPLLAFTNVEEVVARFDKLKMRSKELAMLLPDQYDYVQELRAMVPDPLAMPGENKKDMKPA